MQSPRARGPAAVWDVPLPEQRVRKWDQRYVVNREGEDVVILSDRVETLCTHFWQGRTRVCSQTPETPCWLDHRETGAPRFAGWIAVSYPGRKKVWLLRLTEVALRHEP